MAITLNLENMLIEPASSQDLPAIRTLLERHHLLLDGVDQHLQTMLVARDESQVIGTAGIELYEDGALLRSVAVDPRVQGRRVGHELVAAALRLAEHHNAHAVYLLTTVAAGFFREFRFETIARADVPASVQTSVEFRADCCASAVVMRKR